MAVNDAVCLHTIITADQGTRHNLVDPEDGMILALEISKGDVPNPTGLAWSTEKRLRGSHLSDFCNMILEAADNTLRGIRQNGS